MSGQPPSRKSTSDVRLHRWEPWTDSEGGSGTQEVTVDHRGALMDALLGYDVPSLKIIDHFEALVLDPNYREPDDR